MNKLKPIAILIKKMLEDRFGIEANYTFEGRSPWLLNIPSRIMYGEIWDELSKVYGLLLDNTYNLEERITLADEKSIKRLARMDIWFAEPYNFICEFDENQHFNQYRRLTLENSYENFKFSFNKEDYLEICTSRIINPGTSGFHKLKSKDCLFPAMYECEKQDNRLRQRAFRDFLKDIVPIYLGYNPTMRINYKVTNGKIKGFDEDDLNCVKNYILKGNYLENIFL